MRELLPDNIALTERLAALPQGLAPPKPPGERDCGRPGPGDVGIILCHVCGRCGPGPSRESRGHAGLPSPHCPRSWQVWGKWLAYLRRGVPPQPRGVIHPLERAGCCPASGVHSQCSRQGCLPHASTARKSTIRHQSVLWPPCFRSRSRPCKIPQPPQRRTAPPPAKEDAPHPTLGNGPYAYHGRPGTAGSPANVHMHMCARAATVPTQCLPARNVSLLPHPTSGLHCRQRTPGVTDGCLFILRAATVPTQCLPARNVSLLPHPTSGLHCRQRTPGVTDGCLFILPGTAAHWIS